MKKKVLLLIGLFCLVKSYLYAQVEIYKSNPLDTATYIAPDDTITKAPMYGDNAEEFYRYIENRYNTTVYGQYLSYYPEKVSFSFYVEKNGSISDFKILYASNLFIGNEIQNIVTIMPKWSPGKEMGKRKKTLMIYDISIQITNDFPAVLVTPNGYQTQFSNKQKSLKWFLFAGSIIIMITFLVSR